MGIETAIIDASPNPDVLGLDIIVPAHNHLERTMRCLRYLYLFTRTPFHLIVVDDSTDLTPAYMAEFQKDHKNVTYIHSDVPYKDGNSIFNVGFNNCKTELVATVMNSVSVEPEWELVAINIMHTQPDMGTIGFKCLFPNGLVESAGIKMQKYLPCDMGRDNPGHRLCGVYPVDAAQWAFALHRLKAVKPMEEGVFNGFRGWDDIDNCFVVKKRGYKVFYCGLGVGYHEPRATRGSDSEKAYIENQQNGERFYKRWGFWEEFQRQHPGGEVHTPPIVQHDEIKEVVPV